MAEQSVVFAVAARQHPQESVNGDSWAVDWHEMACRLSIIDGLGHGPAAAEASSRAREVLASSPSLDPVAALHECHEALKSTRGAAMSIALIDPTNTRLTYAGVGNIEAHLWQNGSQKRLPSSRGIVGGQSRRVRAIAVDLAPDWLLLLHSDGVSANLDLHEHAKPGARELQSLVNNILITSGREMDDATVLAATQAPELARRVMSL